jgi:hypothetical protein
MHQQYVYIKNKKIVIVIVHIIERVADLLWHKLITELFKIIDIVKHGITMFELRKIHISLTLSIKRNETAYQMERIRLFI